MGEDHTDPSAFLAESIHEMFDEYYSVSLSFWTRSGLRRRPARVTSSAACPGATSATPPPSSRPRSRARAARPRLVRALRHRPGVRPHPRRVAERNRRAHRTRAPVRQGHRAGDAVQRRLCRICHRATRQDPHIKGLHEAIVGDELFDRVQEVRVVAHARRQARPPLRGVLAAQAPPLRALRRADARLSQRSRGDPPLPVLHPSPPRRVRANNGPRASPWRSNSSTGCTTSSPTRTARADPRHPPSRAGRPPGDDPSAAASCRPARATARPLSDGRQRQAPIRHAPPKHRGGATAHHAPPDPDLDRAQALLEDFARFWEPSPSPPSDAS